MSGKKNKIAPNRLKPLNIKQQLFVNNITDIDNNTLGNATQSYIAAYPGSTYATAATEASKNLKKPHIQDAIQQILSEIGMESKVRLQALKEVITGDYIQTTVNTTKKGKKILYKSTSTRTPSAGERIKAVDTVEKIAGTYDKNKVTAEAVSQELKDLFKRYRKTLQG